MRIAVGYTKRLDEVVDAIEASGHPSVWREMRGLEDYYWFLAEMWSTTHGDLAIIEHDIVTSPDVWATFQHCPQAWCVYPYRHRNMWMAPALGCVRFRSELLRREWDLFEVIGKISDGRDAPIQDHSRPRIWQCLDVRIHRILSERGYTWHVHSPPVEHLLGWSHEEVHM